MADNPNRVASFFKTKRQGMLVGGVKPEGMDALISALKEAKSQGKSIVFFLWSNQPEGRGPVAALTVAVERDRPDAAAPANRAIGRGTAPKPDPLGDMFGSDPSAGKSDVDLGW